MHKDKYVGKEVRINQLDHLYKPYIASLEGRVAHYRARTNYV